MNNLMSLGECLFTLVGTCIVSFGIWRAWTKKPAPHMSSESAVSSEMGIAVPGTDTLPDLPKVVPALPNAVPASRRMSDIDIIVLLASQKKGDNWKYTANAIYTLVKGNRGDVTGMIKEVREGSTEYVGDMIARVQEEVHNEATNGTR